MCSARNLISAVFLAAGLTLAAPVLAQPLGLHPNFGTATMGGPLGLKFRLGNSGPALLGLTPLSVSLAPAADDPGFLQQRTYRFAAADWGLNDKGLHASMGYLWRDTLSPGAANGSLHALGDTQRLRSTPFVGLGWQGSPFSSKQLQFSADVGTFFSSGACQGQSSCLAVRNDGLKLGGSGDGIRWSPYIFLGAHLDY